MNDNTVVDLIEKAGDRIGAAEKGLAALSDKFEKSLSEIAQKMAIAPDSAGPNYLSNPVKKAASDPGLVALRNRQTKSAIVSLAGGIDLLRKSTIVGDTQGSSEEGYAVQAQRAPGLYNDPRRPLSLLDVLPRLSVTSNAFEFNRLDSYSSLASYQASEGALKPETTVPTTLASAGIATIAHWVKASTQVLADAPALEQQLKSLLSYGVLHKLEREVIAGDGSAGHISGLTDAGNFTAFSPSTSTLNSADAIGEAMAALDTAGWRAGLIVLHPDDWQQMRAERATTSNEYLVGTWNSPAAPNVWGCPVVTSPAVSEGFALVIDPSQVLLLDRMQATAEFGFVDDDFVRNLVTLRAELRAGLAVLSPGAVMYFAL